MIGRTGIYFTGEYITSLISSGKSTEEIVYRRNSLILKCLKSRYLLRLFWQKVNILHDTTEEHFDLSNIRNITYKHILNI